jgi:hypothetical protein
MPVEDGAYRAYERPPERGDLDPRGAIIADEAVILEIAQAGEFARE